MRVSLFIPISTGRTASWVISTILSMPLGESCNGTRTSNTLALGTGLPRKAPDSAWLPDWIKLNSLGPYWNH
jgi:hypothetical protein